MTSSKRTPIGLTALVMLVELFIGPAHAADHKVDGVGKPDISAAFKGTLISTYNDGRQARLWLAADGTYTAEGRRRDPSNGHWRIRGEQICLSQSHPHPLLPITYCTAIPSGDVGRSWAAKSVMGDPIRVSLVAGGRSGT